MKGPYFFGIDIGTQGCRTVLVDTKGTVQGAAEERFPISDLSLQEQAPDHWWNAAMICMKRTIKEVKDSIRLSEVQALSVTSTSGTVIPVDHNFHPLHPAIMYSDRRSAKEGEHCRQLALENEISGYTGFNSSSGLSKIVWYLNEYPLLRRRIHRWLHATDYIIGKLSGQFTITDHTNVLKSGYDLIHHCWPDYLFEQLGLEKDWLPTVVASGKPVGTLSKTLADDLGLTQDVTVVSGMTDGCASQVASGAAAPGDWNTTIGTTLVIKGITRQPVHDPEDRLYNHRHPDGYWMPGGASNVGADWVAKKFGVALKKLNDEAKKLIPTKWLTYPLSGRGERFPFVAPHATGFEPEDLTDAQLFASGMEGVAYVERYAFELISELSGEQVVAVYTAGGGSNNETWRAIRANVLNLPIYKMQHVAGAAGAAILAASNTCFSSLHEATRSMCTLESEEVPDKMMAEKYEGRYRQFIQMLRNKGYIQSKPLC